MKKFMKNCYKCGAEIQSTQCVKDKIKLNCMKCPKCGEEYFTSSELIKYDILSGKRKMVRKFSTLGDSTIIRFPTSVLENYKIKAGDYGVLEEKDDGILIRPVHADELEI